MDAAVEIAVKIFTALIVGGGLWKGLEAISAALGRRSEALNNANRLEMELQNSKYDQTILLLKQQAARIDALHEDIEGERQARLRQQMEDQKKITELECENESLKCALEVMRRDYDLLKIKYESAIRRLEKLEKGDTGPLKER